MGDCEHADRAPAASLVAGRAAPGGGCPWLPPLTLFRGVSGVMNASWEKNIKDGTPGGTPYVGAEMKSVVELKAKV